jgi:hypothetical protein
VRTKPAAKEIPVDWIEQLFGLNPDGGDGSIEILIVGAAVAIGLTIVTVPAVRSRLARLAKWRSSARPE